MQPHLMPIVHSSCIRLFRFVVSTNHKFITIIASSVADDGLHTTQLCITHRENECRQFVICSYNNNTKHDINCVFYWVIFFYLFQFNFVGRILGPRGMTAKQLEQETGCKIMVRGKGSMRDKKKVWCIIVTRRFTQHVLQVVSIMVQW